MSKELAQQAMANFKRLRAEGANKISLSDTLPEGAMEQISNRKSVKPITSIDITELDFDLLDKYHRKAKELHKSVSSIDTITDREDGTSHLGFTYTNKKGKLITIYSCGDCMVLDDGEIGPHEIGLYEL